MYLYYEECDFSGFTTIDTENARVSLKMGISASPDYVLLTVWMDPLMGQVSFIDSAASGGHLFCWGVQGESRTGDWKSHRECARHELHVSGGLVKLRSRRGASVGGTLKGR